jgi:hypothetical protein
VDRGGAGVSAPSTLAEIARGIGRLRATGRVDVDAARQLAAALEEFAAEHPNLDPDSHTNLLTQLARTIDPLCPRDNVSALAVIAEGGA